MLFAIYKRGPSCVITDQKNPPVLNLPLLWCLLALALFNCLCFALSVSAPVLAQMPLCYILLWYMFGTALLRSLCPSPCLSPSLLLTARAAPPAFLRRLLLCCLLSHWHLFSSASLSWNVVPYTLASLSFLPLPPLRHHTCLGVGLLHLLV